MSKSQRTESSNEATNMLTVTLASSPPTGGLGVAVTTPRTLGPADGSDHLFLLPERALGMDSTHLRQDLEGLDFNLHLNLMHMAPRGNVWLCESTFSQTSSLNIYPYTVKVSIVIIIIFFFHQGEYRVMLIKETSKVVVINKSYLGYIHMHKYLCELV